ncbi:MAG: TPM domain-containing protein, partial [Phycisphaerales bacterium]|nr:TPM domain-containing protein [Phycisphaerales bacterium]
MGGRRGPVGLWSCATISLALTPAASVRAEVTHQDPGSYVVDRAGVIDSDKARTLESILADLEAKTTAQIKVLTVQSTDGEDVFGFAQRHASLWKLGQTGKDNGALIVVSTGDREVRIETGYGLEHVLTDAWCASAARQFAVPNFKNGDYTNGIALLAAAAADRVAVAEHVSLEGIPEPYRQRLRVQSRPTWLCGGLILPLIVIIVVMSSIGRRRRYYGAWGGGGLWQGLFWASVLNSSLRGGRSHWG